MASNFTTKKQQGIQYSKTVQVALPFGVTTNIPQSMKAFKCQPSNITGLRLYFGPGQSGTRFFLDIVIDGDDDGVVIPFRPAAILPIGGSGTLNVELLF